MRDELERHTLAVQAAFCPQQPMAVGLWFSAPAAAELLAGKSLAVFRHWLAANQLIPLTLNGFPYGNFHQAVVKYAVYQPVWGSAERTEYTRQLVQLLHAILPDSVTGSISTLPIAWKEGQDASQQALAARELLAMARYLDAHEARTGRRIVLCLEPEPGCILQRSADVVDFFQRFLLIGSDAPRAARYLGVCHDVCHAAVMFESQTDVLSAYQAAGVAVGKVQLSSALRADFSQMAAETRQAAWQQLQTFAEDRYLHQTSVLPSPGVSPPGTSASQHWSDLPLALRDRGDHTPEQEEWRVHFHVPIYLSEIGALSTTQQAILECLQHPAVRQSDVPLEVETYAWGVLPADLMEADLATGIARELRWAAQRVADAGG